MGLWLQLLDHVLLLPQESTMPREEKRLLTRELLLLTRRCLEVIISRRYLRLKRSVEIPGVYFLRKSAKSPLIRLGVNSRKVYIQLKYYTLAHFSMKQLENFLHNN